MPALRLFLSYSRTDKELVAPIAAVLRISATVFRDEDSIAPGKRWADELAKSLDESNAVLVFWSLAASESKFVESEYRRAIDMSKDVVPVLLDDTPLVSPLAEFQWIDFRSFVKTAAMRGAQSAAVAGTSAGCIPLLGGLLHTAVIMSFAKKIFTEGWPYKFDEAECNEMRKALDKRLGSLHFDEG